MNANERRRRARVLGVTAAAGLALGLSGSAFAGCPEDLDGDCQVGFGDLLVILGGWGTVGGPADLDGSGVVDFGDIIALFSAWGPCAGGTASNMPIAGNALGQYPFFEYVRAFNQGAGISIAVDPRFFTGTRTADAYIVAAKTTAQWGADPSLTDVRGGPQVVTFSGANIQANTFALTGSGSLSGAAGIDVGVGFDIVLDFDQDGVLGCTDFIDGLSDEAGAYVVHDVTQPGPLAVTEINYNVPNWTGTAGRAAENLFYPTNIATMGELPLIIMSRGNGHNLNWYDHLGNHMVSYGYIFMSHENETEPGVFTASTTTLLHTDTFLGELASIAGGALVGHVDTSRITWIGHSRGGEGVAIAYDRLFDGTYTPNNYSVNDIKLVSSIAPTDFLTGGQTDPHGVAYHLWTAAGDSDVNGCANCNLCQTFHLHDRAECARQSISLYGVGHGDFHNGGGNPWFTGPCRLGITETHLIMKGYLLPLVKHYIDGNIPSKDFLTRQYESFEPIGAPVSDCKVVDLMYREDPATTGFTIDDYQVNTSSSVSSSGGAITFNVAALNENRMDDSNTSFTTGSGTMNGFTVGGSGDDTRGVNFEWSGDSFYEFAVIAGERDFTPHAYLSFRACQETRDNLTIAVQEDLTFTVTLSDGVNTSSINIGAYGGGVEEPYQRTGCGTGTGWANEFETIRIDLASYLNNGSNLDLTNIVAVRFEFGPSFGSAVGRIGLDDVELTSD